PTTMENNPCRYHQAARDRANGGALPKFGEGIQRLRVDSELAVVRNGLNNENPGVSAAKAPADRAGEAYVIARVDVVFRQQLGPARIEPHAFAPNHGRVEVGFEQARACAPDVEIAVAAGFEQKKDGDEETDEHHRQG